MKVAMVGHKVIPSRRGGIENVLTSLCPLLVEKGIDVTCYNRSSDKVENEYIGTVKDKKYKGVTLKNAWTINRKGLSAMVASFTAAICAAFWKYDIVHFHAEGPCAAMWIPKMFGKKCVATVHGLDWQREKWGKGFASRYIKFGERVMVKCADEIIVLSESAREYFKKTYNRDTVLIHNGIDKPAKKEADEITKIYGLSKGDYICIVSRLTAEKGVHYLIDAYNSIKTNKKLVIAGDTSDTDEYVKMIKQKASGNPEVHLAEDVEDAQRAGDHKPQQRHAQGRSEDRQPRRYRSRGRPQDRIHQRRGQFGGSDRQAQRTQGDRDRSRIRVREAARFPRAHPDDRRFVGAVMPFS